MIMIKSKLRGMFLFHHSEKIIAYSYFPQFLMHFVAKGPWYSEVLEKQQSNVKPWKWKKCLKTHFSGQDFSNLSRIITPNGK